MHVDMMDPRILLEEGELVGHADEGAAQLPVHHLEVLVPEMLELLQDFRGEPGLLSIISRMKNFVYA